MSTDPSHYGQLLKKILSEENITIEEIVKYTGYTKGAIKSHFGSEKISKRVLMVYGNAFQISLRPFGEDFSPYSLNNQPSRNVDFISLGLRTTVLDEAFFDRYFDSISKRVRTAKEEIVIYQYLAVKKDNPASYKSDLESYFMAKKRYLYSIYEQLSVNKTLTYKRILALPIEAFNGQSPENTFEGLKKALEICEIEIFEHMWMCLNSFEERVFLYVLNTPSRLYSFGYVDDSHAITQYDRYRRDRSSRIDSLFVETIGHQGFVGQLIESYRHEIDDKLIHGIKGNENYGTEKSPRITDTVDFRHFKSILERIKKEYIDEINREKDQLVKLNNGDDIREVYHKIESIKNSIKKNEKFLMDNIQKKLDYINDHSFG